MQFTSKMCIDWILDQFPDFRSSWEKHLDWWGDDEPGLGNGVAAFADFAEILIRNNQREEVKRAMAAIEQLILEGDTAVRTAVATNCLENLINRASQGRFDPEPLVQNLGRASKAFCMEWDRFTGTQTPGLLSIHDDD